MRWQLLRFILAGAGNTILSWIIFALLTNVMQYLWAYTLAYVAGIVISYFLNVQFVFRGKISIVSFLKFPLAYLVQYAMGIILMWVFSGKLGIEPEWAMVWVTCLTIPVTFIASRVIIKGRSV